MPDPHVVITGAFTRTYYTVTALPPASTQQGEILYVTDSAQNPMGNTGLVATGGGAHRTRVQSDGANWRVVGWNDG